MFDMQAGWSCWLTVSSRFDSISFKYWLRVVRNMDISDPVSTLRALSNSVCLFSARPRGVGSQWELSLSCACFRDKDAFFWAIWNYNFHNWEVFFGDNFSSRTGSIGNWTNVRKRIFLCKVENIWGSRCASISWFLKCFWKFSEDIEGSKHANWNQKSFLEKKLILRILIEQCEKRFSIEISVSCSLNKIKVKLIYIRFFFI